MSKIQVTPVLLTEKAIRFYADHPIEFVVEVIGATPDDVQAEIMQSVANEQLTSVRSGHGIGKSAVQSWLMQWFLYSRPFPKIPCTAPTKHQLFDILWSEANKWLRQSAISNLFQWTAERIYHKAHPEEWFAVARTASQPDALQGFHAEYIFYILDEGSGIPDKIFEPVLGALSTENSKLIACGNPTQISGWFYDSHNKNSHIFNTFKVSGEDSSRVSQSYIQMVIDMYGKDSDVYRVRVAGDFPKSQPDSFIPLDWIERNSVKESHDIVTNPFEPSHVSEIDLGVDVARYGDDTSIIDTVFNKSSHAVQQKPQEFFHNDTMELTGQVVLQCKRLKMKYPRIQRISVKIDCDGLGAGVYDRLVEVIREEGLFYIEATECHFGGKGGKLKADDPIEMEDSTGLMWGTIREKLRTNTITLWYHEKLISQLSTRKYRINSNGKIKLEKKEEMKKRGLPSPDRGDGLGLALFEPERAVIITQSYL